MKHPICLPIFKGEGNAQSVLNYTDIQTRAILVSYTSLRDGDVGREMCRNDMKKCTSCGNKDENDGDEIITGFDN